MFTDRFSDTEVCLLDPLEENVTIKVGKHIDMTRTWRSDGSVSLEEIDLRRLGERFLLLFINLFSDNRFELEVVLDLISSSLNVLLNFGVTSYKVKWCHAEEEVISDRDVTCKSLFVLGFKCHGLTCTLIIE